MFGIIFGLVIRAFRRTTITAVNIFLTIRILCYANDYNFYIDDLPLTLLDISEHRCYSKFNDALQIKSFINLYDSFTENSLFLSIIYANPQVVGNDFYFNTPYVFCTNHAILHVLLLIFNIVAVIYVNAYFIDIKGFVFFFYLNCFLFLYINLLFFWNYTDVDSYINRIFAIMHFFFNLSWSCDFNYKPLNNDITLFPDFHFYNLDFDIPYRCNNNTNAFFDLLVFDVFKLVFVLDYPKPKYIILLIYVILYFVLIWFILPKKNINMHLSFKVKKKKRSKVNWFTLIIYAYRSLHKLKSLLVIFLLFIFPDFFVTNLLKHILDYYAYRYNLYHLDNQLNMYFLIYFFFELILQYVYLYFFYYLETLKLSDLFVTVVTMLFHIYSYSLFWFEIEDGSPERTPDYYLCLLNSFLYEADDSVLDLED